MPDNAGHFIAADHLYPLEEFKRRMGMGRDAYQAAKRAGLPVRRIGRLAFVLGSEVLDWLKSREGTQ